jgi:hypothetical protein
LIKFETMPNCKNCQSDFEGKYCNNCGQKFYTAHDKSLKHFLEEVFHFLTHFEGSFFTSLSTIYTKPGKLSEDYCGGIRKKYYKPISLYLLLIVLYLIFPLAHGLNVVMEQHRMSPLYGAYAAKLIEQKEEKLKLSDEKFTQHFEEKSAKVSKILLLLFIPYAALLIYLLYFYAKPYIFDVTILATEINVFYLSFVFILFPAFLLIFYKLTGRYLVTDETTFTLIPEIIFIIFCGLSFRKMFKQNWILSILNGLVFASFHFLFMVFVYRLIVFQATMFLL